MAQKHHYISQFYLKYFSPKNKPGLIWVYSNNKSELRSIEKHVAFVHNYYTIKTETGNSNSIEEEFSKIERDVSKVIKNLYNNDLHLTSDETNIMVLYMAFLRARIPATRDSITTPITNERRLFLKIIANNEDLFNKEKSDIQKELCDNKELTFKEFQDYINKNIDKIDLEPSNDEHIKMMFVAAEELFKMLIKMKWNFLKSPVGYFFITSDRPVFPFMNNWKMPYSPGFAFKDVEVYFPLSPTLCTVGTYTNLNIVYNASGDMVNCINSRIINNSYKYIYSNINWVTFKKQMQITIDKFK